MIILVFCKIVTTRKYKCIIMYALQMIDMQVINRRRRSIFE